MRKNKNLRLIQDLKCDLVQEYLKESKTKLEFDSKENICLTQFLGYRILLNLEFNKSILKAVSSQYNEIKFPLPKIWRIFLEKRGFKANTLSNKFRWFIFSLKWYFFGVASGLIEIKRIVLSNFHSKTFFNYFINLSPLNLHYNKLNLNSNNIITWYVRKFNLKENVIYHSVKGIPNFKFEKINVFSIDSPIPPLTGIKSILLFSYWFLINIFISLFSSKKKLLFRERVLKKVFSLSKLNSKGKYLFHNSGIIFRPLWTYEAEKRGLEIVMYFYSLNYQEVQEKGKNEVSEFYLQITSWPNYFLWNAEQLNDLLKRINYPFNYKIVGPIQFSTLKVSNPIKIINKAIIVFDIQPKRDSFYTSMVASFDYYTTEYSIKFLNAINNVSKKLNLDVVIKRKRKHPKNIDSKKYLRYLNYLIENEKWVQIDPDLDVSSASSSKNIIAAIGTPFTSALHFTRENKIPSVFFDPSNKMIHQNSNSVDFNLIGKESDLLRWLKTYTN